MGRTIYPPEVWKFIEENHKGKRTPQLTQELNELLGSNYTVNQIAAFRKNHHFPSGLPGGWDQPGIFTEQMKHFIEENVAGIESAELTQRLNEAFGANFAVGQIRAYKKNHKLSSGLCTQFKKGQVSHNAGKKGLKIPGSEKGYFKSGHRPHNWVPIGTETLKTVGYIAVKVAEPNVWEFKHRLIWQEAHGEIPPDVRIIFLDANPLNLELENLAAVTNDELLEMNRNGFKFCDPDLTSAAVAFSKLKRSIAKRKKSSNP